MKVRLPKRRCGNCAMGELNEPLPDIEYGNYGPHVDCLCPLPISVEYPEGEVYENTNAEGCYYWKRRRRAREAK